MTAKLAVLRITALLALFVTVLGSSLWLDRVEAVTVFETRSESIARIVADPSNFPNLPLTDRTPELFALAVRTAEKRGLDIDPLFYWMDNNPRNTVEFAGNTILPRYPSRLLRFPRSWWTPAKVRAAAEMSGYWGFLVARESPEGVPMVLWRKMSQENNRSDFRSEAPQEVQKALAAAYPNEFWYDGNGIRWK